MTLELTTLPLSSLAPPPWRANHVLRPDLRLLQDSMLEYGWLGPLVARPNGLLIDGSYRLQIAETRAMLEKWGPNAPVLVKDVDEIEAMVMHVRLNRARGVAHAKQMSRLVQAVMRSGRYEDAELQAMLRMSADELDLLLDGTLIKKRKVAEHTYSRAWVPIEVPEGQPVQQPQIERPPTPDK